MNTANLASDAPKRARRVAAATFVGTTIEWYDFFIYGAAAAFVFGPQFFPAFSPTAGLIASFGTFAAGFIARPVGGILFGHFGDRLGRKRTLVFSLMLMGVGTFLIALLPNFEQIGIAAPILLITLRLVQGLGVGGEWGGAVLMATEHAPPGKRAFYSSFPQMGIPAGIILANAVFLIIGAVLAPAQFAAWGWRIPFVFSALMVIVALFIRMQLEESPEFEKVNAASATRRLPLLEVLRSGWKNVISGMGVSLAPSALGYLFSVYLLSYGVQLGLDRQLLLGSLIAASVVYLVVTGFAGNLADRVGAVKLFTLAMILSAAAVFVCFWLFDGVTIGGALLALVILAVPIGLSVGVQAIIITRSFPTHLRYTGASLSYQMGSVLGGGLTPMIATAIYAATASSQAIALYLVAMVAVSAISVLVLSKISRGNDVVAGPEHPIVASSSPSPKDA
ncbi:MFS transporter [Pseudarthrobacter sp. B4EP4b]|uniref:MFS transporter n=1 Tax=Pseudarthrobacter sp. B4EP4b TaxID=2590664 RepID=UPI001150FA39|nr:MFS transporter [Pseudarthrobacter sp. B4EP4b]